MSSFGQDSPIDRADACGMGAREFDQHDREMRAHRQEGCGGPANVGPSRQPSYTGTPEILAELLSRSVRFANPGTLCCPALREATPEDLEAAFGRLTPGMRADALALIGSLLAFAGELREKLRATDLCITQDDVVEPVLLAGEVPM